jgi:AcrR family transcriptional regulator
MYPSSRREQIVDMAIALAESKDWESIRLYEVADKLDISLDDIRAEFSEKDQLVEAWFDRADSAMLEDAAAASRLGLDCRQRMHRALMAWLHALSSHRKVTRQMILGKLEPGHIHIQIPGLMRVSRTVQWLREAAGYDAGFPRRALEETAHTAIYLATFSYWMFDGSLHSERTARFLQKRLEQADFLFECRQNGPQTEVVGEPDRSYGTEQHKTTGQTG